ncbi:SNARE-like superfamily protein [Actinidia rufa]|uniref:Coatomer subunit zeta n=1 Tax=Actinidia rufa TaxID=165716 RepID=A0A7J0EKL1_9ERIC|nr:SNARE-like superfamily protein [Actinidia rufa]
MAPIAPTASLLTTKDEERRRKKERRRDVVGCTDRKFRGQHPRRTGFIGLICALPDLVGTIMVSDPDSSECLRKRGRKSKIDTNGGRATVDGSCWYFTCSLQGRNSEFGCKKFFSGNGSPAVKSFDQIYKAWLVLSLSHCSVFESGHAGVRGNFTTKLHSTRVIPLPASYPRDLCRLLLLDRFPAQGLRSSLLNSYSSATVPVVARFNGVPAEERLHWRSFLVKLGAENLKGVKNEDLLVACHKSVYIVYTVLGDVSIFVVGKDEYDELALAEALYVINSAIKDVCGKPPTERLFLDKYGKICLCLDEIVWKGLLENTDKDRIQRLIRLKPPSEV